MFQFNVSVLFLGCIFWCIRVQAQIVSNITCPAVYAWMDNAKGQSPCLVSGYLSGVCNGGQWNVSPIGPSVPYDVPTGNWANVCRCNTILFDLISACAICQGAPTGTWSDWIQNCSPNVTNLNEFPLEVPSETSIPDWAYWNPIASNVFVPAEAQNFHPPGSGKRDLTAIIVGSVVGGVAFIALVIGAVLFFIRRKKEPQNPPQPPVARAVRPDSQILLTAPKIVSQRSSFASPRNSLYEVSNVSSVPMIVVPTPRAFGQIQHHTQPLYHTPYSSNASSPAPGSYRGLAEV